MLLVASPPSRIPFWLFFKFFLHHVRRDVLLIILVWLVLGLLHKVHLCIVLHRWVMCWGLSITRSMVCAWLLEGSSSVSVSFYVLIRLSRRIGSWWYACALLVKNFLRHMMTLKTGLRYVLGRIVRVIGVLTAAT